MNQAGLQTADAPFAPEFGKRGELRQAVGETGRVHLDRWLPFIVLHRAPDPFTSIARRVAVNSPAYLIWSPEDDRAAERMFAWGLLGTIVASLWVVALGRLRPRLGQDEDPPVPLPRG